MTLRDKKKHQLDRVKLGRLLGVTIKPGMRIKLGDGYYRLRRGKLVRIPDEWVGRPAYFCGESWLRRFLHYKRPRPSKVSRKQRMAAKARWRGGDGRVPRDRRMGYRRKRMGHPTHRAPRHAGTKHLRKLGLEES